MDTIALDARLSLPSRKREASVRLRRRLDLVPSVITKRVTQLERIVGTTLFHRSPRKVVLDAPTESTYWSGSSLQLPRTIRP